MSGHLETSGHLKTTVTLESIGNVDVSTIDLSIHGWPGVSGIETCLFWKSRGCDCGESEVVATYSSWDEAVEAHYALTNPTVLARTIMHCVLHSEVGE